MKSSPNALLLKSGPCTSCQSENCLLVHKIRSIILNVNPLCHWAQCFVQLTCFVFFKRLCWRRNWWIDLHSGVGSLSYHGPVLWIELCEKSITDPFRHVYLWKWSVSCSLFSVFYYLISLIKNSSKVQWVKVNLICISASPSALREIHWPLPMCFLCSWQNTSK